MTPLPDRGSAHLAVMAAPSRRSCRRYRAPTAPVAWILRGLLPERHCGLRSSFARTAPLRFRSNPLEIHSRQRTKSAAVFGQTTAHLTSRTQLTLGARYTRDERRVAGKTIGLADGVGTSAFIRAAGRGLAEAHLENHPRPGGEPEA